MWDSDPHLSGHKYVCWCSNNGTSPTPKSIESLSTELLYAVSVVSVSVIPACVLLGNGWENKSLVLHLTAMDCIILLIFQGLKKLKNPLLNHRQNNISLFLWSCYDPSEFLWEPRPPGWNRCLIVLCPDVKLNCELVSFNRPLLQNGAQTRCVFTPVQG